MNDYGDSPPATIEEWIEQYNEQQLRACRAEAKVKKLRAVCESTYFLLQAITFSQKGSFGTIDNTYLPQLKRTSVDDLLQEVSAALKEGDE